MEELKTFFRKYEHLKEVIGFSRCPFFEVKTCTLVSVLENLYLLCRSLVLLLRNKFINLRVNFLWKKYIL